MNKKLFFSMLVFVFSSAFIYAQKTVSGTVTDTSGVPLAGASVVVKGTTNGASTDFDGNYSITAKNTDVLVISYVGFKNTEITVGDQANITVTLQEDAESLDEVVINALGFKEKRDAVASTYSVINADEVLGAKEPTLINSLAGKAAGLTITGTSADPGAGSNIQIRGISSINGSSPLIVVDGIPLNNSNLEGLSSDADGGVSQQSRLNDINPDDIETIQVFKGASAGAIYGSRALGGVIVITTKRGQSGKLKVSLSSTISVDQINRKHPLQTKFGQGFDGAYSATNANSWGDRIADRSGEADVFNTSGQYFEAEDGTLYYPYASGGKNSQEVFTDSNFDAVFTDGFAEDLRLNLSGGTEKATFYFSTSRLNQKGIIRQSVYIKNAFTF
jgi:TonB-dependent SusC/RagA subfamily outer membrane receptor